MDPSQLKRSDRDWVIVLIVISIPLVIYTVLKVCRVSTILSIPKQNTIRGGRFVLAHRFTFASFVSVPHKQACLNCQMN